MLDMEALKRALAPIEQVGKDEAVFDVEGHTLAIRPLLPKEEVEVQRFSQEVLKGHQDDKGTDRYAAMDYFDTFRVEALSYALVQVDGLDLREVEYIATGEMNTAGKPIRVPRHVALRSIIKGWSRIMIMGAFDKYTELLSRVEEKAETLIKFDPADLGVEIDRVEKRLEKLKAERDTRAKGDKNLPADQVRTINDIGKVRPSQAMSATQTPPPAVIPPPSVKAAPSTASAAPPPEPEPTPLPEVPQATVSSHEEEWATLDELPGRVPPRPPASPAAAVAVEKPSPEPSPEPPRQTGSRQPVLPERSPPPTRGVPLAAPPPAPPEIRDSFGDPDEEGVIEAELARIAVARRRAQQERVQQAEEGGGVVFEDASNPGKAPVPPGRVVPPHLRGREIPQGISGGEYRAATAEELAAKGIPPHLASPQDPTRVRVPGRDEDAVAERPVETLSNRGRGRGGPPTRVSLNKVGDGTDAANTRFRPPGK